MRITANREDPDYRADLMGSQVWLDGVRMADVMEADDMAGRLVRYKRCEEGRLVLNDRGELETEVLTGKVRIYIHNGAPWPPA